MRDYSIERIEDEKKVDRETDLGGISDSLEAWRQAFADRAFRWELVLTLPGLVTILGLFSNFLERIERRPGVELADPILAMFRPIDATVATFLILYVSLVIAIAYLLQEPRYLLVGVQAYIVLALLRSLGIYLAPFDHPADMIVLKDPVVEFFGGGKPFTKDLFFSGHTSLLFLLYLTARKSWLSKLFLISTISVGICVIAQHVHYSIDVLIAPFMAYASLRLVGYMRGKAVFEAKPLLKQLTSQLKRGRDR
jgi:hypothetical protein